MNYTATRDAILADAPLRLRLLRRTMPRFVERAYECAVECMRTSSGERQAALAARALYERRYGLDPITIMLIGWVVDIIIKLVVKWLSRGGSIPA